MPIKIEDQTSNNTLKVRHYVSEALEVVPKEHLRGLNKIILVDSISERSISIEQREKLPALYHPKMYGQMAWAEIALNIIFPKEGFFKKLMSRMSLKPSITQVTLSLIAQHYYLTISKGIKKNQMEIACRLYIEKHYELWREKQGGLRLKLLKPFKPFLNRMAKKLARRYKDELQKGK